MSDDHPRSPFGLAPEALRCPYPYYESVRDQGRVTYVEEIGAHVVTGYEDIQAVLRQPGRASSRTPTGPVQARLIARAITEGRTTGRLDPRAELWLQQGHDPTLFHIDPPDHTRQRRAVGRMFALPQVQAWEPLARRVSEDLVAELVEARRADMIEAFAVPLPVRVIAHLLRMPPSEHGRLKRWSDDVTAVIGNPNATRDVLVQMLVSRAEMEQFFADLLASARADPGDDLVTMIAMTGREGHETLSDSERLGLLINFLVAGNETTTKLLGACVRILGSRQDVGAALQADRSLAGVFVEEVLRLEPPTQGMFRQLVEDLDVGGEVLPAGSHVYLVFAAGNRDPSAFASPEMFDLARRDASRHLSFGHGPHLCLGAGLARMEARVAVETLADRLGSIRLDPGNTFEHERTYLLHGLKRLDAEVSPKVPEPTRDAGHA